MADLRRGPTMPHFIPLLLLGQKRWDKNIGFLKVSSSFWNIVTCGTSLQRVFMTSADLEISVKWRVVSELGAIELLVAWRV